MQQALRIDTLAQLDGAKIVAAVDHELRQCVRDINDRPGDKAARVVNMQIRLVPVLDKQTGVLDSVHVQFRINSKTPIRQSAEYPMLGTNEGALLFQPHSPTDPRQRELPFQPGAGPAGAGGEDRTPMGSTEADGGE